MIQDPFLAHTVHAALEAIGMAIGAKYYFQIRRRQGSGELLSGGNYAVLVGCLLGAAIGNKLAFWLEVPHLWPDHGGLMGFFMGGQSMVGGLLGGLIGVEFAKRLAGVKASTGDAFAYPILLGLAVGRIGCFLAGLNDGTFGVPTDLPWGIDFGDGIRRHPTQLYEMAFVAALWGMLSRFEALLKHVPGLMFKLMLSAYLSWRLVVDGIKPHEFTYTFGLSGIQWLCLIALFAYLPMTVREVFHHRDIIKEGLS